MQSYLKILLDLLNELVLWQAIRVMSALVPAARACAIVTNKKSQPVYRATRSVWVPMSKWLSYVLKCVKVNS